MLVVIIIVILHYILEMYFSPKYLIIVISHCYSLSSVHLNTFLAEVSQFPKTENTKPHEHWVAWWWRILL